MKKSTKSFNKKLSRIYMFGLWAIVLVAAVFINALPALSVRAELSPTAPTVVGVAPSLGAAASFAVLAGSTVTNTGLTVVNGDIGMSPGTAVTGFPPGTVSGGTMHSGAGSAAGSAQTANAAAYNNLVAQTCETNLTGTVLGAGVATLTPGVYCFDAAAQLTGTLTLDGQGNPNAVFIFQIVSTLTTASSSSIVLINGARACNVFFQVGSSATLGTGTAFRGNILALISITLNTGASLNGRALAQNGAVTLDTNSISAPSQCSTTAAIANLSGRVTNSNGRGIPRTLIKLTDGAGFVRTNYTGPFGYYNFPDVEVGQTFIVEVLAKRHSFKEPVRVLSFGDEVTSIDFIAY